MTVCHVGTMPLEQMGSITRSLIERCNGIHTYYLLGAELPEADMYVLHCFKNHWEKFYNFKRPYARAKVISLMHSSAPCAPALCSDVIVALTHYAVAYVASTFKRRASRIPGGIDIPGAQAKLRTDTFGCIIRNAEGKFHPEWNNTMVELLTQMPDKRMLVITNKLDGLVQHKLLEYNCGVSIHATQEKYAELCRLSVAVFMHGDFEEVFPMAVLECMAVGLPIVYMYQPSMHEMIGEDQACCDFDVELKRDVVNLLSDERARLTLGARARTRARAFSVEKMVQMWNELLRELCT